MEPILGLIFAVVWLAAVLVPVVRILKRLGYSPWLAVCVMIPVVNIAALWALAFSDWPGVRPPTARELDNWSDGDKEQFRKLRSERGP